MRHECKHERTDVLFLVPTAGTSAGGVIELGRGNMGFLRVSSNSETDMWQKHLIAILDIYLSQIGTKLLCKRENRVGKELKNVLPAALFLAHFTRKLLQSSFQLLIRTLKGFTYAEYKLHCR